MRFCVAAVLVLVAMPMTVSAQSFGFDEVSARAQALAQRTYEPPSDRLATGQQLDRLTYDQYQSLRFRRNQALWAAADARFRVEFFPIGFLYRHPVAINRVDEGQVQPLAPTPAMFDWSQTGREPAKAVSFAGFRILFPLQDTERRDEVAVFLGASYFRLLGRDQTWGISARGLAIDTGLPRQEEFPHFTEFWLVTPGPQDRHLRFYALLDSPAVAGAYEFVLTPGTETQLQVRSHLFLRHTVSLLGVAPLTSMFLHGENGGRRGHDFRPEVHDSDGLLLGARSGEWLWRPLVNPRTLAVSSLATDGLWGYGLMQRDRDFNHYQDMQAHYHRRPSLWVEPEGEWGRGTIRLIEIPTDGEANDNIVAFWALENVQRRDQPLEFAYRLHALLDHWRYSPGGRVIASRQSIAGRPGGSVEETRGPRRVIADFAGGDLPHLAAGLPVRGRVSISNGRLVAVRAEALPDRRGWRLTVDFEPEGGGVPELRAYLHLYDQVLTETWLYRWT